jgi:hypothetical protein
MLTFHCRPVEIVFICGARPSTWLVLRLSLVSGPANKFVLNLHMMHDSIVHLLGNTMSDSTVYTLTGFVTRALLEITARVFHLMTLSVECPHILLRCMHVCRRCVTFSAHDSDHPRL